MIVYLPPEDYPSGTELFASIYSSKGNTGPYSIRAFGLPENAILPEDYVYSGSLDNNDSDYEELDAALDSDPWNDDYGSGEGPITVPFDPAPANPVHRYLSDAHDVDWIKIVIP
jgi:hypothetical protein